MRIQVPGEGPRDANIIFVGEQPGRYEVIKRKPFYRGAPAGRDFDACLKDAEIPRMECYVTNTIKALDFPIAEYVQFPAARKPPRFMPRADDHLNYLREELAAIPANVICPCGNIALFALTERWGITKWRGSVLESTLLPGRKVVPTIHPSSIQRGAYLNRFLIIKDLITVREESAYSDIRKIPRSIKIAPSYYECMEHLSWLLNYGRQGHILDFDIEVMTVKDVPGGEMVCLSFAHSPFEAFCIPLSGQGGDYFPPDQEAQVLKAVGLVLEDEKISIRGQRIIFDGAFMLSRYGIRIRGDIHCTEIAQKILLPDFRVGLDFITREYTDINYYKDDGKKWFSVGGPWEQFWTYNGMDTIATAASHPKQIELLKQQGNLETYEHQRKLIKPLMYMMERGALVDIEGMILHRKKIEKEQDELKEKLNRLAGRELPDTFATSSKQVANYFYVEKGIKPYMNKGSITTDVTAMKRLKRRGFEEADIISRLRYLKTKALGTYLDIDKVSPDGRYRCFWKPAGAETGRIASSEDIFGQGTNLMNWPHELLSYLVADPGYCYYSPDLEQAENRVVAYVGNVTEMIRCFEQGIDVHSLVGASIYSLVTGEQVDWQEIKRQDKAQVLCDIGDGTKTWRFYGKKSGHASNYDMGEDTFSLQLEIAKSEAAVLLHGYHRIFPEIRGSYQPLVKQMLMEGRTVINCFGRKRLFLDKWDDKLFKAAYAQIPQSSVAYKINEHGLFEIYYNDFYEPVELQNQIHDSIGFQIPVNIGFEKHAEMLIKLKRRLETPVKWHDREFVIPAAVCQGLTWNKDDGIELKGKEFVEDPIALGKKLQENYDKLTTERQKRMEERACGYI